jgi:hypothetical protein
MTDDNDQKQPTVVEYNTSSDLVPEKNAHDYSADLQKDEVLLRKMRCINKAIDEIGFTSYQLKLFFLNGFGYAVDSLLILSSALTQSQIAMQYQPALSKAQTVAVGAGLLVGALFWGLGADVSLFKCFCSLYVFGVFYIPT